MRTLGHESEQTAMYEWVVHKLIGTVLQRPAERLRWLMGFRRRWKHPELKEIYVESDRMRAVIRRAVRSGDHCVDVGAHLGSVLAQFLERSPTGRHTAIEPLAYKARWLERKFPTVAIHAVAVGDETGEVDFFWNRSESGYSGLRDGSPEGNGAPSLRVPCRRLDDLIPRDVRVHVLKVDVEGGELQVFRGAARILSEQRPLILFECTKTNLAAFDIPAEAMHEHLTQRHGYSIYLLKEWLAQGPSLDLESFKKAMDYPFQAFNFVAAPRERPVPACGG